MSRSVKVFGLAALTGLAVAGLDASAARAQMMPGYNPYFRAAPGFAAPGFGAPMGGMQPQINPAYNPLFANAIGNMVSSAAASQYGGSPYGGYGGYGYPGYGYGYGDSGGALYGAAAVMNAQGQYKVSRQQARLMAEQVRSAQLDNKRRAFDEYLYEQRNTPTLEQLRQEAIKQQLSRSLNEPNPNEIASATALNNVLASLETMPPAKDTVPVSDDVLKRVNVVKGANSASLGLLRDEGKLTFPPAVLTLGPADQTAAQLKTLDSLARDAYAQATAGRVDGDMLKKMQEISNSINDRLTKTVNETPFGQYSEGKRFLRSLDDAIAALQQPDAGDFLPSGKNVAKGKDVAALVKYMADRGLRFAPANNGDEDAYKVLHRALVNYHKSASQVASGN
jgi:hypothetical protein